MIYLLDSTAISDLIRGDPSVTSRFRAGIASDATLAICQPVFYEVMRGLIKKNAVNKIRWLADELLPWFARVRVSDEDWMQAARFWAEATRRGKQLSDIDLLIAAIAVRLDATLVTSDTDFNSLPVRREDWRLPYPGRS